MTRKPRASPDADAVGPLPHAVCVPRTLLARPARPPDTAGSVASPLQSKGGAVSLHQRQIGAVIRAARCARRMTQAQLGRACGYSASAISRIEAGRLRPPEPSILLIARALGLPEHVAPEEVRRPALRALTADLLYAPVTVPGVRELAARTGVS
ncbi:helix-turn-helix domain-containing protein [Kitasatospora sp. NPDC056531]|uniref:helix-turn-helix domain-containing protein n=1 Tax=Kitasatospora sp. NPDC056531 TaxID=3345856 RepID=UPI0036800D6C